MPASHSSISSSMQGSIRFETEGNKMEDFRKYRKIDVHAHIFPEKIREKAVAAIGDFYDIPMESKGSDEDLLSFKESAGIEKFCVLSVATVPKQVVSINNFLHQELVDHPEFLGFATLHPDLEEIDDEIERVISMGFTGIKLHADFQQFDIDSDKAQHMYKVIDGRLPILFHMGDARTSYTKPEKLLRLTKLFPNQVFIGAHFGGYSAWDDAEEYLLGKTGIYIDTSSSLFKLPPERASRLIYKHGPDKVLFGTDYPMWNPVEELERFMKVEMKDSDRENIFYNNAAKLYNIL